jgi:hypothetical protein
MRTPPWRSQPAMADESAEETPKRAANCLVVKKWW